MSDKFPGGRDATGLGITLWEPQVLRADNKLRVSVLKERSPDLGENKDLGYVGAGSRDLKEEGTSKFKGLRGKHSWHWESAQNLYGQREHHSSKGKVPSVAEVHPGHRENIFWKEAKRGGETKQDFTYFDKY